MLVLVGGIMYFAVPLFKSMQKKTDRLNLVFREGLTGSALFGHLTRRIMKRIALMKPTKITPTPRLK